MIHIGGITLLVLLSSLSSGEAQGMWLFDVCMVKICEYTTLIDTVHIVTHGVSQENEL